VRPYGATAAFAVEEAPAAELPTPPPAPARGAIRVIAVVIFIALALLAARAIQLAFSGDPQDRAARAAASTATTRADLVDRNGVLLATTVPAFALAAEPARVWNVDETADALIGLFPDLDRATLVRRLSDKSRERIYLRRGLTPGQRADVMALGLGGVAFDAEERRVYPNGALAAHALGFTDTDLAPLSGLERGLDRAIRAAGAAGRPVRLSLDVRLQYALEIELDAAAGASGASGAAGILVDARSGETLAIASWPRFDPNDAGAAPADARRDRAAGSVYELGSAVKPFTIAMALDSGVVNAGDRFDVSAPFAVDGARISDHEPVPNPARLIDIMAHSSNIGAAQIALRVGRDRQRAYLTKLGLLAAAPLELSHNEAPLAPEPLSRRDVAGLGFGYGLAATPAALAGAYTVFANDGARVPLTLRLRDDGAAPVRTPVFSPAATRAVLAMMRAVVTSGTGREADVPGLDIAGKTGTAEKLGEDGAYDESRNFSSFAGIFPAGAPRYVIMIALDEPREGAHLTGGAVAAPVVAAVARRAAPILGLSVAPAAEAR
jgi:cell division protein FtsI (penicillin-binding protein 3)